MIALAILAFTIYLILRQSFEIAITIFVTILVIVCSCSLGLKTPFAIIVSEGMCATNGILIKKSEILENTEKTNVVIFDKTGTLTYGQLKIAEIKNYSKMIEYEFLQLVERIKNKITFPIGKAFVGYLIEKNF